MMTIMVYSYSGLLISSLTVPRMTKPIETLEEVATSNEVILFINPDQGLGKRVMVMITTFEQVIFVLLNCSSCVK